MLLAATVLGGVAVAPQVMAEGPQDPWYMDTLRIDEVWQHTRGEGITVAVIDTGVDASLPALEGQVLEGTNLTYRPGDAHVDNDGHGTDMAALIAGTGAGGGIRGIAPAARILPVRAGGALEADFGEEERWAQAIEYAVESGAQIINISLGTEELGMDREAWDAAIAEAARQDVLIFAATGNEGHSENTSMTPADRDGVVGVGAVDRNGNRAQYSTYGPQVSISAPGDHVPETCPDDSSGAACLRADGGTSSATALASASAALIWSAHPDWTKNQVLRAMVETADGPGNGERDDYIGYGMVRPDRVILDNEGDPGDADTNPLFADYEATLDPPPSPAPVPEPGPSDTDDARPTEDPGVSEEQTAAGSTDDSDFGPLVLIGIGVAVLLGGILAAVVLSRRRSTTPM